MARGWYEDGPEEEKTYGEVPKVRLIYSGVVLDVNNLNKVELLDVETDELYEKPFQFTLTWKDGKINSVSFIDEVPFELLWKFEITRDQLIEAIKNEETVIVKRKRKPEEDKIDGGIS